MRSKATVTAVALLALAAAAVPARAAADTDDRKQPSGLFLTVSGAGSTWIRGVLLQCAPGPSGPHPDATGACAALDKAKGDFDTLPGNPRACTKQYEPVTVSASGSWRGVPMAWHKTYPNACVLETATGPVFRF
ncbi:subtilase-type protease inhibitor [Streptomyces sp. ISL-96]|uniref:subtilase-type protease inhibitor n=1 Tax=Streptomyces sp. ISL-96 TaxID=2819191 RepID=UPI001BE85505|nr:subtilase-type protease inhibitor [Streptomyces sp. ISL-96]MBT2488465.1 subtilase-type protease inhibitor [Streptomyces sp. ISL-96]